MDFAPVGVKSMHTILYLISIVCGLVSHCTWACSWMCVHVHVCTVHMCVCACALYKHVCVFDVC